MTSAAFAFTPPPARMTVWMSPSTPGGQPVRVSVPVPAAVLAMFGGSRLNVTA